MLEQKTPEIEKKKFLKKSNASKTSKRIAGIVTPIALGAILGLSSEASAELKTEEVCTTQIIRTSTGRSSRMTCVETIVETPAEKSPQACTAPKNHVFADMTVEEMDALLISFYANPDDFKRLNDSFFRDIHKYCPQHYMYVPKEIRERLNLGPVKIKEASKPGQAKPGLVKSTPAKPEPSLDR